MRTNIFLRALGLGNRQESPARHIGHALLDEEDVGDISDFTFAGTELGHKAPLLSLLGRVVRRKRFILSVMFLIGMGISIYLYRAGLLSPEKLTTEIRQLGYFGPLLFILVYALMVATLLPTLPMNFVAGVVWGGALGALYTVAGASAGAILAFALSRYLFRQYLHEKFQHPAWSWMRRAAGQGGWQLVAFTRVNPVFPFGPINYFFGITGISFLQYSLVTVLAIIPPCLAISYLGASVGSVLIDSNTQALLRQATIAGGLIAILYFMRPLLMRKLSFDKKSDNK